MSKLRKLLGAAWDVVKADPKARKATAALVVPLVAGIGAGLTDGSLTWGELATAAGLGLSAAAAVYRVENKPKA